MTTVNDVTTSSASAEGPVRKHSIGSKAKRLVNRFAPGLAFQVRSRRRRNDFKLAHGSAEFRATEALVAAHGRQVLGGPFKGLKYGESVSCSAYVAKLVGSYEEELHETIEKIISRNYKTVIDVGCAEGYYAVGLAKRMPQAKVYAFDADPDAKRMCRGLARLNAVQSKVVIGGWCDHAALERLAGKDAIVVCDCEGFELDLLDPVEAPILRTSDMLVELHDLFRPEITPTLLSRFEATHNITLINTRGRDAATYEILSVVAPADRPWAVREGRHAEMQWAYFEAKSST